jgi:hypothetical protein
MTCRPGMFQLPLTALLPITLQLHVLLNCHQNILANEGQSYVSYTPYSVPRNSLAPIDCLTAAPLEPRSRSQTTLGTSDAHNSHMRVGVFP